jgi:methionyl-tRNA formyltransferase
MNKLKIGYFADGVWSHNAFKLINNDERFDIKFICPRYNAQDAILKDFAELCHIDYIRSENVNSGAFLELIDKYKCDMLVSLSFDQIFKKEIINAARLGIINCHAGKLPFYRGRNVLNWVLINDEKEFGITVHYVDEGIDTGDIILQKIFPISDNDDYSSLLRVSHIECANILYEAMILIHNGNAPRLDQKSIHPVGMYCGARKEGDDMINWDSNSRDLFNFIRALSRPSPIARCFLAERKFLINRASMIDKAPLYKGIPGQVLYKDNRKFVIKTKDSILKIEEYFYDGTLKVGDRLKGI